MTEDRTWQSALSESKEEFIHNITRGAIQELENDNKIGNIFDGTEYENMSGSYESNRPYGNPLDDVTHTAVEDKRVPKRTVECLKHSDSLYKGVAMATRAGLDQMEQVEDTKPLSEYSPQRAFSLLVGIAKTVAGYIEIDRRGETYAIFFNDPTYITSV